MHWSNTLNLGKIFLMNSWKIAVLGVTESMERNDKRLTLAYWDKVMEKESEVPLDRNSEQEPGCVTANRTRLCHSFCHGQHQLLLVPTSSLTTWVKFKIQIPSLGREGAEFRNIKTWFKHFLSKIDSELLNQDFNSWSFFSPKKGRSTPEWNWSVSFPIKKTLESCIKYSVAMWNKNP